MIYAKCGSPPTGELGYAIRSNGPLTQVGCFVADLYRVTLWPWFERKLSSKEVSRRERRGKSVCKGEKEEALQVETVTILALQKFYLSPRPLLFPLSQQHQFDPAPCHSMDQYQWSSTLLAKTTGPPWPRGSHLWDTLTHHTP